jgi:rhamnose utilization protein RhaD (predicted bifunctional aldolase and dehydrogenase)
MTPPEKLVQLSRDLGEPARRLVIIGEGNTSLRVNDETFWVKASGHQMPTITPQGFAQIRFAPILALFDDPPQTNSAQRLALRTALVDDTHADPSVETSFHAMLLHDCGVNCIAHTHPIAVNRLLCSTQAETFARRRIYPDEVVLCGPESVFVPYVDPGLPLAMAIREQVHDYMDKFGEAPKVILMANHGLIALGQTTTEALNITMMADKAAEILWGAMQLGDVPFMSKEDVMHIYRRPDEIYRRKQFLS